MQNLLKKISLSVFHVFILTSFTIIIGCQKPSDFQEVLPKPNNTITISNSKILDIRASDVYTTFDSLQRKIEIINKIDNTIQDVFFITLKSNNFKTSIYTQLKNKTFTGTLSIVNNNQILFLKGGNKVVVEKNSTRDEIKIKSNLVPSCNVTVVHNCVANKIDQMSIFEYGLCLVAAPECYATLWASCGWTNCITGEQNL
jgi:hypothetical protein